MSSTTTAITPTTISRVWPVLNDKYTDAHDSSSPEIVYTPFSRFPIEIKLLIWKTSLLQNRLITVCIEPHQQDDNAKYYTTTNAIGNIVSGKPYGIRLVTDHQLSPLLRVCQSSRQAALDFYRVQIPATINSSNKSVYFNPEWDFLHIKNEGEAEGFADFIHDLKASDPQSVGLRHIVWGNSDSNNFLLPLQPSRVHPRAMTSFTSVLSKLHSIYFHNFSQYCARRNISLEARPKRNHSYPLSSRAEPFVLTRDPRPIFNDMELTGVNDDPRRDAYVWDAMETAFGITRPAGHEVSYKYMLISEDPTGSSPQWGVRTRRDADEYLAEDDETWRTLFQPGSIFQRIEPPNLEPPERRVELGGPMDVFGFWLFELRAFGALPERGFSIERSREWSRKWDSKMAVDLSRLNPLLGVHQLPNHRV